MKIFQASHSCQLVEFYLLPCFMTPTAKLSRNKCFYSEISELNKEYKMFMSTVRYILLSTDVFRYFDTHLRFDRSDKSFRSCQSLNCHKIWQFRCLPFVLSICDSFNIEGQEETDHFSDDKLFCEHAMNLRKADFKKKTALKLLEYYFEWHSSWCLESLNPFCIRNRAVVA